MKYIDADKLIAEIQKLRSETCISESDDYYEYAKSEIIDIINSLQQEQSIRGPHIESWIEETKKELQHEEELLDMRLETLKRIRDKKNQFQQERPEVELEREIRDYFSKWGYNIYNGAITMDNGIIVTLSSIQNVARHFWNKGYNARKED
jgi:N-acetylglucosamine-6-phosphate deacetylase